MNITLNGKPHFAQVATIAQLVQSLELNETQVAIEKNQAIIPRTRLNEEPIRDGDRVEVVRFIGGG